MPVEASKLSLEEWYAEDARRYCSQLPQEHFMEATPHATQRTITLESLDLVSARRPDFQVFNELLVQYPMPGKKRPAKVVPDNMVVICDQKINALGSYAIPLQPVGPYWILEYVSKSSQRKDYDDNMRRYERDLRVPYYLIFDPEQQELTLYRHQGEKYNTVLPNGDGRLAIPELEMEVAILDDWVRFWHQGELLPLPADLDQALREANRMLTEMTKRANAESKRADTEKQAREALEREVAQLRAHLNKVRE